MYVCQHTYIRHTVNQKEMKSYSSSEAQDLFDSLHIDRSFFSSHNLQKTAVPDKIVVFFCQNFGHHGYIKTAICM